ncbi:hypothetical protein LJB83_03210, partial [Clostridia bacterium OttesenSCG-928-F22]|nr:hypothetical protein [Clostridia bacterium OttesenSCG-928-F22]
MKKILKARYFIVGLLLAASMLLCIGCGNGTPAATGTSTPGTSTSAAATPTPAPATSAPVKTSTQAPSPSATTNGGTNSARSLWLSIGMEDDINADLRSSDENDQGIRADTYMYEGKVGIAIERLLPYNSSMSVEKAALEQTASFEGISKSEIETEESTVQSYPACRLFYKTTSAGNTSWNMDLYIQTDQWDFRIHVVIPIELENDYADEVIRWFYAADFVQLDK